MLAENIANNHAVDFSFPLLYLPDGQGEVDTDDVREHDAAIKDDIWRSLSVDLNLNRINIKFLFSLSLIIL